MEKAVAHQLEWFAAIAEEEPPRAAKLLGAAEVVREKIDSPMTDYERGEYDQSVAQLRTMLAEAEFHTLWAEGRAMTMEQAIELALNSYSKLPLGLDFQSYRKEPQRDA